MIIPDVIFKTAPRDLAIGRVPAVVGTISSDFRPEPTDVVSDIVELRLDLMGERQDWRGFATKLQAAGIPVIATLRLKQEGGNWERPEEERLALYRSVLPHVAALDVEYRSSLAPSLALEAKALGRVCIVSFHDFAITPAESELRQVISGGQQFASIVKITTMLKSTSDLEALERLLSRRNAVPLCVMGMGNLGSQTRISFPTMGSCLTYGYLDAGNAPGQLSAEAVVKELCARIPQYAERRRCRSQ